MDDLYDEAFVVASGQYLTKHLPDDYADMPDEDFNSFIEDNIWEGMEHLDRDEVVSQIAQLADIILRFHRDQLRRTG